MRTKAKKQLKLRENKAKSTRKMSTSVFQCQG